MYSPNKYALAVLAAPELRAASAELPRLQRAAVAQVAAVAGFEANAARGAILAGLTLLRVKASLERGRFTPFLQQILPQGRNWTPATAVKNASYYMRLALVFVEKTRVQKPDLLALPGDQTALDLGDPHAPKAFVQKLAAFVGDLSLNELLIKHGIKGVGLKTALEAANEPTADAGSNGRALCCTAERTAAAAAAFGSAAPSALSSATTATAPAARTHHSSLITHHSGASAAAPASDDRYFAHVAQTVYDFREIVTSRASLMRLTPTQLAQLEQEVTATYAEFRRLMEEARGAAA